VAGTFSTCRGIDAGIVLGTFSTFPLLPSSSLTLAAAIAAAAQSQTPSSPSPSPPSDFNSGSGAGIHTHLRNDWYFLASLPTPLTKQRAADLGMIFWFMKAW
jgi:hypothetical protein